MQRVAEPNEVYSPPIATDDAPVAPGSSPEEVRLASLRAETLVRTIAWLAIDLSLALLALVGFAAYSVEPDSFAGTGFLALFTLAPAASLLGGLRLRRLLAGGRWLFTAGAVVTTAAFVWEWPRDPKSIVLGIFFVAWAASVALVWTAAAKGVMTAEYRRIVELTPSIRPGLAPWARALLVSVGLGLAVSLLLAVAVGRDQRFVEAEEVPTVEAAADAP